MFWQKFDLQFPDGLNVPSFLRLTAEQRHAYWEANPPKTAIHFADPRIEADKERRRQHQLTKAQAQQARAKIRKANRIAREKEKPFSTKGLRWDPRRSKWISDTLPTQENDDMARLKITPYDANGLAITRAVTSVKEDATTEQVDAQIAHAFKRGGKKAIRVEVTKDGQIIGAHALLDFGPKIEATAAREAETAQQGQTEEEADMAKKRKSVKASKKNGASEKGYKGHRAGSRKEKAHQLFDELGPEKAKTKVIALGIKANTVSGWFSSFRK